MDNKQTWTACSTRLPNFEEGYNGYFWCWDEDRPDYPPDILEAYGRGEIVDGFCHEGWGTVKATHWHPIIAPPAPKG